MSSTLWEAEAQSSWQAPEQVTGHARDPLLQDVDFFAPPPAEIGDVLTARSSLRRGVEAKSAMGRLVLASSIAALLVLVLSIIFMATGFQDVPLVTVVCAGAGTLAMLITWLATAFKHQCSYVGTRGMARYTLKGSRAAAPREELVAFDNAANLTAGQTRQFVNGIYSGTSYSYRWTDEHGRVLLGLSGTYKSKEGNPKASDPWHFAASGERAWNVFLLDRLQSQLEQQGYVEFRVNGNDLVRVGPGFLEFVLKGQVERLTPPQIKSLSISQGTFHIDTHEARWLGRKGKYRFNYAAMANAQLFLHSLHRLMGYQFN